MVPDLHNYYNSDIQVRHDHIHELANRWVEHCNFMMSLSGTTEQEIRDYRDEIRAHKMFDL